MVDVTIRPSRPTTWDIEEKDADSRLLGTIVQSGNTFLVMAGKDNILTGISLGPYPSKEDAMDAIGKSLGGTCEVLRV